MASREGFYKISEQLKEFFSPAFFNEQRLKMIFEVVQPLNDSQFERIVQEFCMKEQKPGVNDFAFKVNEIKKNSNYGKREVFENHENCKLCGDIGIVFVKTVKEGSKSLAMQCTCDCDQSKLNFWELPKYSADFCMIDFPYSMKELKDKMTLNEVAAIFTKHMKHSKKVWDGEE